MDSAKRVSAYTKLNGTRYQVTDRQARRLKKKARRDALAFVNDPTVIPEIIGGEHGLDILPDALMVHFSGLDFIPQERKK